MFIKPNIYNVGGNMEYNDIVDLCKEFSYAHITYHINKHNTDITFWFDMEKKYDNEVEIRFDYTEDMEEFADILLNHYSNDNCNWHLLYGDDLMKEYDILIIWWN